MAANVEEMMKMRKEKYERAMESTAHPYLLYRMGNSKKCIEQHMAMDGLILPKDDPWWNSNFLQNDDPDCNCFIMALTEERKKRYEAEGITTPPSLDGTGGGKIVVKTIAPV